jgi:hypothetical protein
MLILRVLRFKEVVPPGIPACLLMQSVRQGTGNFHYPAFNIALSFLFPVPLL